MLKIAICEDVKSFAVSLEKNIQVWAASRGIKVSIRKFDNGNPLLYCINDNGMFDIIFMDVEMDKMNGLETAEKIREVDFITTIIFISQYEDYYKEAYNVHPFHFLNKPITQDKLDNVMNAYLKMKSQDLETFTFSINKAQFSIYLRDIMYFYSERRHVYAVCKDKTYVFYDKLNAVQKAVENKSCRFLRIHQSYLVNMRYVKEYHYTDLVMHNGDELLISKENRKSIREIHMLLLEQ